jgi:hypothetical protein
MRLLEALHKTNRPPHCIDTDVRAAACWRSCCIKKCRKRKYAGGLNVEYVKNVERKAVEQFNFDGSTIRLQPAQHHPVQAPSYMSQQHPNILQHQPRSPYTRSRAEVRSAACAAALQRSAPSAATSSSSTRARRHTLHFACDVCQGLIWRDAWGGVV